MSEHGGATGGQTMEDSLEKGIDYTARAGGGKHDLGWEEGPLHHSVTTGTGFTWVP